MKHIIGIFYFSSFFFGCLSDTLVMNLRNVELMLSTITNKTEMVVFGADEKGLSTEACELVYKKVFVEDVRKIQKEKEVNIECIPSWATDDFEVHLQTLKKEVSVNHAPWCQCGDPENPTDFLVAKAIVDNDEFFFGIDNKSFEVFAYVQRTM